MPWTIFMRRYEVESFASINLELSALFGLHGHKKPANNTVYVLFVITQGILKERTLKNLDKFVVKDVGSRKNIALGVKYFST